MSAPPAFLRCRLTAGLVALPVSGVVSLEGVDRLQRSPRPGPLAGWLLGTGYEAPVYDLSALLGLPPLRWGGEVRVVLYGHEDAPRGLLVQAAEEARPEGTKLFARPRLLDRRDLCAWAGVIAVEGELVPWLDPSRLHAELTACGAPRVSPPARQPLPRPSAVSAPALLTFESGAGAGRDREAGSSFALSVSQVVEVVELGAPVPLPAGPDFLLGLIEWRGRALPLVDLGIAIGRRAIGATPPRRALIARTVDPTDCVALAAGEIEMRRLPLESQLIQVPEGAASPVPGAVLGCAEIEGKTVFLPDLERILNREPEVFGRAA